MTRLLVARRTLRDRRTSLIWWAIGLAVYLGMIMAVWPVIDGNEDFASLAESYPEGLQAMFGGTDAFADFTSPAGFLNTYAFSLFVPFILVGLAVSMGAALLAGEEESGLLDLLLGYPISRTSIVTQKSTAIAVSVVVLGLVTVALIAGLSLLVDLDIGIADLVAATTGSVLFALVLGLVAMLAGASRGGRGFALGMGWAVALGGYLLNVVSGIDESLDWLKWLSPLSYATMTDPISNGFPAQYLALTAAVLVVFGATLVAFNRHDLT
jgi:ABC-2 type transport system permease protein